MAYRPPQPKKRGSPVGAEAALVLTALFLAFAAGIAGFAVGRATAEDDEPAAAATTEAETTEAATTEETETEEATTAETETESETETEGGEAAEGAAVYEAAGCGTCHTFAPAGSTGQVGPPLDNLDLSREEIETQVRNGGGGMPAFGEELSDEEIRAVSDYVEQG
jgi:mono/diheme cytochrome c family protein